MQHDLAPSPLPAACPEHATEALLPYLPALEPLADLALVLNEHRVIVHTSTRAGQALGRDRAWLIGRPFDELVLPDDLGLLWQHRAAAPALGGASLVLRLRDGGGGFRTFTCSSFSVPGAELICGRDIADQVRWQRRLVDLDLRHRMLLDVVREGVMFLDGGLCIQQVNPRATAMLRCEAADLVGRAYFDTVPVWDDAGQRVTMDSPFARRLMAAPTPVEVWRSLERRDGSRILVCIQWTPIPGPVGHDPVLMLTLQDGVATAVMNQGLVQRRKLVLQASGLTPREYEILKALAAGEVVASISERLDLSVHSVRGHVKGVLRKLGAKTQLQAVVLGVQAGLVALATCEGFASWTTFTA
ncbi:MAG TPA: PAS domain-containing protein [Kineosporiaceae bacterium]|nr:PAS domain-containing protein [Kineosporiaceae bacterium]